MLFRSIDTFMLKQVQPRTMPHLSTYIETMNIRRGIITSRYVNAPGYESNIVVLLRKILADADIPSLLRKETDLDCYLDELRFTAPGLNSIFDAVVTGLKFYDMVVMRSSVHTDEFIIPVQCQDPIGTLPFDMGWEKWQTVNPLRLIDIDSLELTLHTYQDQIKFTKLHPTRAVLSIDVVALVLQYVNFLRESSQELNQPEYLHRYVLINLMSDLEDIWLSNVYAAMIKQPAWVVKNQPDSISKQLVGEGYWGWIGSELPTALKELAALITACRGGSITTAVLIASLPLTSSLVPAYLKQLIETTSTEDHRQLYWMEWLRDRRFLNLMLAVYQLQPEFIGTKNLFTALRRDIPLLINQKPWNNCHDSKIGVIMKNELQEIFDKCSTA